jgi:hypothetical protein
MSNISKHFTIDERFHFLETYVILLAEKKATSLIISGDSGLGKSYRVMNIIKSYKDLDYFVVKGFATPRALYDTLYHNRNNLVIFDDCDSILEDKVAINILKGALDSYDERIISWLSKTKDTSIPLQFDFQGQVIFISNKPLSSFSEAMKSRALTIDVFMTTDEKISQMYSILRENVFMKEVNYLTRIEVANLLKPYMYKDSVNFRTLEKAIKVYIASNEDEKSVTYIGETE